MRTRIQSEAVKVPWSRHHIEGCLESRFRRRQRLSLGRTWDVLKGPCRGHTGHSGTKTRWLVPIAARYVCRVSPDGPMGK